MKRQFMKSLMALCTGVMTLVAASSLFVSCYDDSALREDIEGLDSRLAAIENLKTQLSELAARVDALCTISFQVSDKNELQYSFDGKTWNNSGVIIPEAAEGCGCPEVSLVDNGDTVTITVGDASFTIEKPEEIVFEIRAGKMYFVSEGTLTVNIKSSGIQDISVLSAPKGWWAEINSDGKLEITAPDYESTQPTMDYETWEETPAENAATGYVKVHACSAEGKCMVGKVSVEVASSALIVKAHGTKAYFNIAGQQGYWAPTFYYGISLAENLESDTKDLMDRMNEYDYSIALDYSSNWGESFEVEENIADLLGEEPKVGTDYVVWAILESWEAMPFDINDLVYTYYSPVSVEITEVETERTPYNVTINVDVKGAESYVAVAMPQTYCSTEEDVLNQKQQMVDAMAMGEIYGQHYKENYSGSALDIAAETSYSMTGNYAPASDVYVMILPMDGRDKTEYTVDDVVVAKFTTAPLEAGGSIDLTAVQITEYEGEVFDYDIYESVVKTITLDPYTELGVELTKSNDAEWVALYYSFLDAATYAEYPVEEDLVDYLVANTFGMTSSEIKTWPAYLTQEVEPNTTVHFVAVIVDEAGKYGKLAHVEMTSKELVKAEFEWVEPYTTNLTDGILKNSTVLEFTPVFAEGSPEAASYKYALAETTYYNKYEGMDDAQLAEELFFSTASDVVTVQASDLVDGKIKIEGHKYGKPYFVAVLPIDAEGNPGASAAILTYDCVFEVTGVITEGDAYEASKPTVTLNLPADDQCFPDYGWGDGAYYGYAYSSWDEMYQFYYEVGYSMIPVEGTEVCTALVDGTSYDLVEPSVDVKTGNLWGGAYGSWKTAINTAEFESSLSYYNHYEGTPAPDLYLLVSWKDAEGNFYYDQIHFQEDMQRYYDLMIGMIYGDLPEAELTVAGKQWSFDWTDYAMMMGLESMPSCLDFGVSVEGYFMAGIDYEAIYGPEAAGMWMAGVEGYYEIEATDATSGLVKIMTADFETGDLVYSGTALEYSNLTETTCTFNGIGQFEGLFTNVQATLMDTVVNVMSQGIAM